MSELPGMKLVQARKLNPNQMTDLMEHYKDHLPDIVEFILFTCQAVHICPTGTYVSLVLPQLLPSQVVNIQDEDTYSFLVG